MAVFLWLWIGSVLAAPKELEVWFLTPPRPGAWAPTVQWGPLLAQTCERVGDYCLDPDIGLYKPETPSAKVKDDHWAIPVQVNEPPQLPTASSLDRNMISCDPKYAFDLFCGEARPDPVKAPPSSAATLEVWIDTSSSMREMDAADAKGDCGRGAFVRRLAAVCPLGGKTRLKVYDVGIRETSDLGSVCQSQGQNNTRRLMEWIDESMAPKVIVITDVNEYNKEFADFISARNGTVRGDSGSFTAGQLAPLADTLASACR